MDKCTFKDSIKKYYDDEAAIRNSKSKKAEWKENVREKFFNLIARENKHTLLELGAGAGYDSLFFKNNGLCVTAVDLSSEMVRCCQDKGIDAYELDFYNLTALDKKFDCVYAINTLLHVPKSDLSCVLHEVDAVLNDDGLFYLGLYGGNDTESSDTVSEISDAPRFFMFYSAEYLKNVLWHWFTIVSFDTLEVGDDGNKDIFHSIVLRKKTNHPRITNQRASENADRQVG